MKYLILSLSIILLVACDATKKTNAVLMSSTCKPVVKTNELPKELYNLDIEKVSIVKNCMIIDASMAYTKVNADAFELRWNGKMKKSMPPQVTLVLHKENGGEAYEMNKFQLKFDLSVLNSMGRSMITLRGWDERIEYNPTANE